jgi:hypothetical protein
VRLVLAVEQVLPGQQVTDPVAEELETSEPAIGPAADLELEAVWAMQELAIVRVAERDSVGVRELRIVQAVVRVRALDLQPARAPASAAAEAALVIAVSHPVRALVRAATLLAAAVLAVALRDQPAAEEVIAWAAVASAVEVVAEAVVAEAVVAGAAAEVGDKQRRKTMNKNVKTNSSSRFLVFAASVCISLAPVLGAFGATIPAGTTLMVRTLNTIYSVSIPGTPVRAQLVKNVIVNGKVLLPAGTEVSGEVVTSKRTTMSKQKLTVNVNTVKLGGRSLPIKTTGAYQVEDAVYKTTRRNISITTHGYPVPAGLTMQFKLAQPLQV